MPRADLIKKLFLSFKQDDNEQFYKIASEIIDDERKKNHNILADDLRTILNGRYLTKRSISEFSTGTPKNNDKDTSLVDIVYPDKYLMDLIITEDKMLQLEEIIKEFSNWDILVSNGAFPIRRVLFYGPPGCGKTLAAHALASEMGLPLLYVRFDAIISSYLGETASNIRKVFEYAKNDSWLIFFDEFDAIGRSRNDLSEHGEIKRVVNAFLQQLDNYKGRSIIIAATNYEQSLDYAIWRRFDDTIRFDLPNNNEKLRLIKLKMNQFNGPYHTFEEYIDKLELFSHSDIEKMCLIIIKRCILEGKKIYSKKDIEYAVLKQANIVSLRKTQY